MRWQMLRCRGGPVLMGREPPVPVGSGTDIAQSARRVVGRIVWTGSLVRVAHATTSLYSKLKVASERHRGAAKLRAHARADYLLQLGLALHSNAAAAPKGLARRLCQNDTGRSHDA